MAFRRRRPTNATGTARGSRFLAYGAPSTRWVLRRTLSAMTASDSQVSARVAKAMGSGLPKKSSPR